jgi:hypothetical protein
MSHCTVQYVKKLAKIRTLESTRTLATARDASKSRNASSSRDESNRMNANNTRDASNSRETIFESFFLDPRRVNSQDRIREQYFGSYFREVRNNFLG